MGNVGRFIFSVFGAKIVLKIAKNDKKRAKNRKNEKKSHFFTKKFAYIKKKVYLCTRFLKTTLKQP